MSGELADHEHVVARTRELGDGDRVLVDIGGRELAVFRIDGGLRAYPNWCPHQGGPLCEGPLGGTTAATFDWDTLEYELEWVEEGHILRCPWHSWEFDLAANRFRHDPRISLPSYPVREEDGDVIVSLG